MENDYKMECYEKYYGEKEDVIKTIDQCKFCSSKLVFSHFSDYKNFIIQETARCLECGDGTRKVIYILH